MKKISLYILTFLFLTFLVHGKEGRLLRFPAVNGKQIVFSYAGNLYTVNKQGGIARKITNGEGVEIFAAFSNDGSKLAFTGQYDGNTEVYVMPSEGGVPERITYTATLGRDDVSDRMGPNNIVMTWTPDDKHVLFRSRMKEFNDFKGQLYLAPVDGGLPEQLPLPRGGFASYSPDGKKLAYNRVFREFRTWKGYRGGMADDVWIFDFDTKKIKNITNHPSQDIIPMWVGDKIYFASDRDGRMNLFVYDTKNEETKKLTDFTEYDIKFPSAGNDAIVFENGGYIYLYDINTGSYDKVEIEISEDFETGMGGLTAVKDRINSYEISPDGGRVLFTSRGDIFTVPAEEGITYNLTESSGAHDRNAVWSPDGKYIAYISDKSGEDEVYIKTASEPFEETQLTSNGAPYKYYLKWSPDSKKLLYNDRDFKLNIMDINSKDVKTIIDSDNSGIYSFDWAPDSKFAAYSASESRKMSRIYIYSLEEDKSYPVTDEWYDSSSPVFSDDGKYLYFVSGRDFNPVYSWTEWNHAYTDMNGLYLVTLDKKTVSPLAPKNDEVKYLKEKEDKEDKGKEDGEEKKETTVEVQINFENIGDRIVKLPVESGSYGNLQSAGETLYYTHSRTGEKRALYLFDFKEEKEKKLGEFSSHEISADNKKMLLSLKGNYYVIDLPKSEIKTEKQVDLAGLEVNLDRHAEWEQIFNQAWRQARDFFYVPNMHGIDWEAVKTKYEPLLEHVSNRLDLTYVIGEMLGELNAGHAYVGGGETPEVDKIKTGLLGAELSRDEKTGYYKIEKILSGRDWDNNVRSPLNEVGLNVNEGDYIIKVNHKPVSEVDNIYSLLAGKAGRQALLTVNGKPEEEGSRNIAVKLIDDVSELYYIDWVAKNIQKVNKATDGRVGYIHVPDMGPKGLNEFMKHFYPQLAKDALIIDVRGNGGGNVSPMLIERLRREAMMVGNRRGAVPGPDPSAVNLGPKVVLMDEFSASDGDLFPYRFRQQGLGKLIGKRSWGGVVGIAGSVPYVDGGTVNIPEFGVYNLEGTEWIIEGKGVEPDIVVDNDPYLEYTGVDQQLQKAVEVVMEELKDAETKTPPKPAFPEKPLNK